MLEKKTVERQETSRRRNQSSHRPEGSIEFKFELENSELADGKNNLLSADNTAKTGNRQHSHLKIMTKWVIIP